MEVYLQKQNDSMFLTRLSPEESAVQKAKSPIFKRARTDLYRLDLETIDKDGNSEWISIYTQWFQLERISTEIYKLDDMNIQRE